MTLAPAKRKRRIGYVRRAEVEVLIPLHYNDGKPIEPAKRRQTIRELVNQFGGCRFETGVKAAYEGFWRSRDRIYHDLAKSIIVEVPLRPSLYLWLSGYKRGLQRRFGQIEVYISVTEIKRIV